MDAVTIAREPFAGWQDTYRVANGLVEARVVTEVGPRILELRRVGGENLFHVREDELGGRHEPVWRARGGWRLWVAPERHDTTYALDNAPCEVTRDETQGCVSLRVLAPPQPAAGIRKELSITIDAGLPRLRIESRIRNVGGEPVTYAPWTIAALRPGGRAFVPLDVGSPTAFDAIRRLILWSYTRIDDPRYRLGDRLVEIDHAAVERLPPRPAVIASSGEGAAQRGADESKIGVDTAEGWGAYLLDGTLYVKHAEVAPGPRVDGGATVEVYSSREFIELENLGPLATLAPEEEAVLSEEWWLAGDVTLPPRSAGEEDLRAALDAELRRMRFSH